uniref:Uncharacterized protein n=1 Tax=Oryza nivara TaxID=4536 RepID=A0A0E0HYH4_ORYNI
MSCPPSICSHVLSSPTALASLRSSIRSPPKPIQETTANHGHRQRRRWRRRRRGHEHPHHGAGRHRERELALHPGGLHRPGVAPLRRRARARRWRRPPGLRLRRGGPRRVRPRPVPRPRLRLLPLLQHRRALPQADRAHPPALPPPERRRRRIRRQPHGHDQPGGAPRRDPGVGGGLRVRVRVPDDGARQRRAGQARPPRLRRRRRRRVGRRRAARLARAHRHAHLHRHRLLRLHPLAQPPDQQLKRSNASIDFLLVILRDLDDAALLPTRRHCIYNYASVCSLCVLGVTC